MKLSEEKLHNIIKEVIQENLESEYTQHRSDGSVEIDNFQEVEKLMDFKKKGKPRYYVQIIRREKDNPNINYKGWYCSYHGNWAVRSIGELERLKPTIVQLCKKWNARAYILLNSRDADEANHWAKVYMSRGQCYGHELESAYGRSFPEGAGREICFLDIDSNDVKVHERVHQILKQYNIKPLFEYETLNSGLHIVLPSRKEAIKLKLDGAFEEFDGGEDRGMYATVGVEIDKSTILYACMQPQGYKAPTQGQIDRGKRNAALDKIKLKDLYNRIK